MPASMATKIADALTAALNSASPLFPFVAERAWARTYDLRDLDELRVTVTPRARVTGAFSRSRFSHLHQIDVTLHCVVAGDDSQAEASVDSLAAIAESVADWLSAVDRSVTVEGEAYPVAGDPPPTIAALAQPTDLDQSRLWTSIVTVSFHEWRARQ